MFTFGFGQNIFKVKMFLPKYFPTWEITGRVGFFGFLEEYGG